MAMEWLTVPHTRDPSGRTSLTGCWERSLLRTAGGRLDTRTPVTWLQGPSLFVDLRLPAHGPAEGFAGVLTHAGGVFEWHHEIDLAPPSGPDAGTLTWDGDVLVERGVHEAYVEHWRRARAAAWPCWGVRLADSRGRRHAVLVRAGVHVGWASGPGARGPGTGAGICLARIAGDSAVITRASRHPAVGTGLRWAFDATGASVVIDGPGGQGSGRWRVTYREGDVRAGGGPA